MATIAQRAQIKEIDVSTVAMLRRLQNSALLSGPMLVAWLGLVLAPCAMALSVEESASQNTVSMGVHADCPNAEAAQTMTDSDCCCDLTAFTGTKAKEPVKTTSVLSLATDVSVDLRIQRRELSIAHQRPPPGEIALPVYLTTQRLRI